MKERKWIKHQIGQIPRLAEHKAVLIFVNDGAGSFMEFMAHHEGGIWFVFDPFENKFRPYRRQQYVTHYRHLDDFPPDTKKKAAKLRVIKK